MTTTTIKVPDIGEGVAEAELVEWHVAIGDLVAEDQIVAALMTDKATVEIPSPASGRVLALGAEVGGLLAVGAELLRMETEGRPDEKLPSGNSNEKPANVGPAEDPSLVASPASSSVQPATAASEEASSKNALQGTRHTSVSSPSPASKPTASPAVRQRAMEAGVDLRQVHGTGPAGRITTADLQAHLLGGGSVALGRGRTARTSTQEIKVTGLRRRIAERMALATRRIAHFSYVEEIDVTALEELRATLNERFGAERGKLTAIAFLIQAMVRALPEFPQMNATYDDEAEVVTRHHGIHIGIATQTDAGLMVPVVRHGETRDLWDSAAEVRRLAMAARDGSIQREELQGSTITITSLGALGGIASTPVINRPEVAIVGVNKQAMRPIWRGGTFVPRLMMNLSSSFDHRVIDGHDAARFVQAVKTRLEEPALLLIHS